MILNTTMIFVGICSYFDLKQQKLKTSFLGASGMAACLLQCWWRSEGEWSIVGGIGIGVGLLFLSYLSRERIGYGDGCVFLVTGILLGFSKNVELLVIALLGSSVWALYLLVIKKKKGTERYPFLPFVFMACVGFWVCERF